MVSLDHIEQHFIVVECELVLVSYQVSDLVPLSSVSIISSLDNCTLSNLHQEEE